MHIFRCDNTDGSTRDPSSSSFLMKCTPKKIGSSSSFSFSRFRRISSGRITDFFFFSSLESPGSFRIGQMEIEAM